MNYKIKKLILDYIFQSLNKVYFDIWETNYRSQKSIEKLGGERLSLEKNNKYLYLIEKIVWGILSQLKPKTLKLILLRK